MKNRLMFLCLLLLCRLSYAETWDDVTGGLHGEEFISLVSGPAEEDTFYIGSETGLYKRSRNNGAWKMLFEARGKAKGVHQVLLTGERGIIYIATGSGLFESHNFGKTWKRLYSGKGNENNCLSLVLVGKNREAIYLGTKKGLFWTNLQRESVKRAFSGSSPSKLAVKPQTGKRRLSDSWNCCSLR